MNVDVDAVLAQLGGLALPERKAGMARFGIEASTALGVSIPDIRKLSKNLGKDHNLALDLWATEVHEARILAAMVDEPDKVSITQMDDWVKDFNSWDLCDQVCSNLFDRTEWRFTKAMEFTYRESEFEKRAGFVLMACIALHDKKARNELFHPFFRRIVAESNDNRNFVKKGVNWALRQIGKRNQILHRLALDTAKEIRKLDTRSGKWISVDAIRELENPQTVKRIVIKSSS